MVDYCVCAEPIKERGVYPCAHALCLSCTLKKRTLMKDNHCPYCRLAAKTVAVVADGDTDTAEARIDFQPGNLKVQNKVLVKELRHILNYPCPSCDEEQKSYKALKSHVQKEHNKVLCDVCTKHEFNFSDEYRLFDEGDIKAHLKKQHVCCKYCRNYYYGITEFSKHCKETHMGCGICERRDPEHPLYFKTYEQLYQHYKDKHYLCMVPACLENKHIVFGTALELKRHMLEAHRGLISNSKHSQHVDLDQLSQDAEGAQASTSRGPSANELESEKVRYEARLDIITEHDKDKIEKLRGANATFIKKKVPVEIFIATYESVLSSADPAQITALLAAFKRSYQADMTPEAKRALEFKLSLRSKSEREQEEEKYHSSKKPEEFSSSKNPQPSLGTKRPTANAKFNWAGNLNLATGISDISALPKLGSANKSSTSVPAASSSGRTWNTQTHSASFETLSSLPKLVKKTNPFQSAGANSLSIRQKSAPVAESSFISSLRKRQDASATRASPPSSALPSSSTSLSSSPASSSRSTPDFADLPKLPSQKKVEKKRQRNVLRIV